MLTKINHPKCGIYQLISPSNKSYIGQSININSRFKEYRRLGCVNQRKIYNALKKYGPNNFQYLILEECKTEELDDKEQFYITKFDSFKNGYNCNEGGGSGTRRSEEARKNLSKAVKNGLKANNVNRSGVNNSFYGKTHTAETKAIIKEKRKYQIITDETRNKMSLSGKGRKFSKEHKRKKSIAQLGSKNPIARKVIINGKIFETIREAQAELKINYRTIHHRINSNSFPDFQYY